MATKEDAINHFEYGISHDIFSEPVTTYARMAIEALRGNESKDIYTFKIKMCDNEVDKDLERFNEDALDKIAKMYVGRTGIVDTNKFAHIYDTEVVKEYGKKTTVGDTYCWLKGYAYIIRTNENKHLIDEIENGIKKEVSIGCSVKDRVCSICGEEYGYCEHKKGETYDGKLCFAELRNPESVYEWAFVQKPKNDKRTGCWRCYMPTMTHNLVREYRKIFGVNPIYCPICGNKLEY